MGALVVVRAVGVLHLDMVAALHLDLLVELWASGPAAVTTVRPVCHRK